MTEERRSRATPARAAAWRRLVQLQGSGMIDETALPPGRDRAQAEWVVRSLLRRLGLVDALVDRSRLVDPSRTKEGVRWVIRLAVHERIWQSGATDYATGEQAVELARLAGGEPAARFVNHVMRKLLPALPAGEAALRAEPWFHERPREQRLSVPEPLLKLLEEGYGESGGAVVTALAEGESPVWLRVNTLRTTPAEAVAALAAEGVEVQPREDLPEALLWSGGERRPWETACWNRGGLTVQDLGSMLAARLLDPAPGCAFADLCAAPGGKTGHLWERMTGRGRLVAVEIASPRRRVLRETLARLYGADHGIEVSDQETLEPAGQFDRVLIDAPCQTLGLIRRHPEVRWDNRLRDRRRVLERQREILADGARWVAPGGRLIWMTCSPTREENEGIVADWVAAHGGWRIVDLRPAAARLGVAEWAQGDELCLRTRPDKAACDAFALMMLERVPSSD